MGAGRGRSSGSSAGPARGILHFSGNLKPWDFAGDGPCRTLYRTYQDQTAWAGWRPPRRWYDGLLGWYEVSRLRRFLYPAEQLATIAVRNLTRRHSNTNPEGDERD
jgi:hypothetical protein